ncbi:GTPase IMAP family member 6-like, partial [Salvelinus sp. IW2-2015]|uniref:GTPase IMAP family member 6-like n=1 Tax=Salvelinus sp. IW2-2015 TaxID=2691554 RepID=UPI000CEAF7A6
MAHRSKPVQQTSRPLQVVLLGKTGAGISATGNTILGRKDFLSKKRLKSVTANIEKQNVTIEGRDLVVYDTPGFCNRDQSEEQIQEKFQDVLKLTSSGPCVFLLVVKADRLTEEEKRVISKVEGLLGESLLKQTWILFTRGDELEDQTIEEFIEESDDLTEVMRKYGGRYHVFNNKRGDPEHVKSLLEKTYPCLKSTVSRSFSIRNLPKRRIVLPGKSGVGKSATGNTILGGRSFHSEQNWSSVTRKTEIKQAAVDGRDVSGNRDLSRVVEQCGGRYHVLNNKARGSRDQVTEVMEKIDRMVEENGGTCYTNEMFEDAARAKKEEVERIQREEEERMMRKIMEIENMMGENMMGESMERMMMRESMERMEMRE